MKLVIEQKQNLCININNNRLISGSFRGHVKWKNINIYEAQYKGEIKGSLRLNSVGVWELTLVALPLVISVITGIWFPYTQKPGRNLH